MAPANSRERISANDELPQHDASGVDVRTPIHGACLGLLRRHVGGLAFEHADTRFGRGISRFGDAEISEFDLTVVANQDVPGRHVSMDDT